jgi:glycosyltransferase involved in cell wall biosynthesis
MSAVPPAVRFAPALRPQPQAAPRRDGRLRLLLLTDTGILGAGGSETFLRQLVQGLDPARYAIDVVQLCAPPGPAALAAAPELPAAVRLEYWPVDAVYGAAGRAAWRRLWVRLRRGDYDLVQSQHEKSDLICSLLPRGPARARLISSRRDTGFQKSWRLRLASRCLNRRFDAVTAPALAVLDAVREHEGLLPGLALAIPNGVDTERFRPLPPKQREAARAALGLEPGDFAFGCVARMAEVKRHCDLLRAFARLGQSPLRPRLLLAGDGPLEHELRQQAQHDGIADRVTFLGARRDVDTLLPALDAFVLASRTEGLSNAVLEAMACGLPVVATAVGGQPEAVEDGVTGLLVPPRAPASLALALEALLHAPARCHRMGRLAREAVLARFSRDAMLHGYDTLYRQLARHEAPA